MPLEKRYLKGDEMDRFLVSPMAVVLLVAGMSMSGLVFGKSDAPAEVWYPTPNLPGSPDSYPEVASIMAQMTDYQKRALRASWYNGFESLTGVQTYELLHDLELCSSGHSEGGRTNIYSKVLVAGGSELYTSLPASKNIPCLFLSKGTRVTLSKNTQRLGHPLLVRRYHDVKVHVGSVVEPLGPLSEPMALEYYCEVYSIPGGVQSCSVFRLMTLGLLWIPSTGQ